MKPTALSTGKSEGKLFRVVPLTVQIGLHAVIMTLVEETSEHVGLRRVCCKVKAGSKGFTFSAVLCGVEMDTCRHHSGFLVSNVGTYTL